MSEYEDGFHSDKALADLQSGSQMWQGKQDAEMIRARQAEWDRQGHASINAGSGTTQTRSVATGASGFDPEPLVLLEGGILSCVALYRNWPQYLSLYSSFPRINVLWEYGVAVGLVLLSAIFYLRFCKTSRLFTWGSFIIIGAILAAWSRPWGLTGPTCLAGFLVVVMFFNRRALLRAGRYKRLHRKWQHDTDKYIEKRILRADRLSNRRATR
jgi:hypothetical protein